MKIKKKKALVRARKKKVLPAPADEVGPVQYVLGFMFSGSGKVVLLVKVKPEWQAGQLNGIGGKVEPMEVPAYAMLREFEEETGIRTELQDWDHFCTMQTFDEKVRIYCFKSFVPTQYELIQATVEQPRWIDVLDLMNYFKVIWNLKWLVPMALDACTNFAKVTITDDQVPDRLWQARGALAGYRPVPEVTTEPFKLL